MRLKFYLCVCVCVIRISCQEILKRIVNEGKRFLLKRSYVLLSMRNKRELGVNHPPVSRCQMGLHSPFYQGDNAVVTSHGRIKKKKEREKSQAGCPRGVL